ncbi:hypothetical protein LBMAG15_19910 [Actinomycetes bacterium]|nr:hypothetical protein LBMAG15_19910 [Actinomycetes bacterium]
MILINCPNCGPRNSSEFRHAGEAGKVRDVTTADPATWRRYLYEQDNPLGWVTESWFHTNGCRSFLRAERHTGTNEIRWVLPIDDLGDVTERAKGNNP